MSVEFIEAPVFTQALPEYLTERLLKAAVDEEKRQRAKRPLPRRK